VLNRAISKLVCPAPELGFAAAPKMTKVFHCMQGQQQHLTQQKQQKQQQQQ
jgi:hypothetical protein